MTPVNDLPLAVDDTVTLDEDGSLTIDVMNNDTLSGDAPTHVVAITQPSHGLAVLEANGSVTYTPNTDYNGGDSFTYTIEDENGDRSTALVNITVNPMNDIPIAIDSVITGLEDTVLPLTLNDFGFSDTDDASALPAAIRIESLPVMGLLLFFGTPVSEGMEIDAADVGLLAFMPFDQDSGSDEYSDDINDQTSAGDQLTDYARFDFSVSDGEEWSQAPATMEINIVADADAPKLVASEPNNTENRGDEGTEIPLSSINASLVDTDGSESLQVTLSDIPSGSTLSDGVHTYTAPDNAVGTIDISNWDLNALSINVPSVAMETTYILHVNATSTEYSNGDSETVQLPIEVTVFDTTPVDPILQDNSDTVFEAALPTGTDSSSNAEQASGNLLSDDIIPEGSTLSNVTIVGGTTDIASDGIITVTTAEGNTLVVDSATGAYTYTLINNIDHPTADGNNSVVDSFTYTVTDVNGMDWSANYQVTIIDDVPEATTTSIDLTIDPVVTNLSFIVDMSSSMDTNDRDLVKASIDELISRYDAIGTVNVNVVEFWGDHHSNSGWQDANYDYEYVKGTSGTDIEQGLSGMVNESYSGHQPTADQDIMYFFGDGNTYGEYRTDFEDYLPTWNTFVTSGTIDKLFSFSVNTSNVLSDIVTLADNGENIVSKDPVNISDIADLEAAVSDTIVTHAEGNLVEANGVAIIDFGADGGHIDSIEIAGNTLNYNPNSIVQTLATPNGVFEINFETGAYTYMPSSDVSEYTEHITVSVIDNDGDKVESILLNINIENDDGGLHLSDGDDSYDMGKAIGDIVHADDGDDTITMRSYSHGENYVYGGEGEDTLILNGYRAYDENYNIVNNGNGTYTLSYDGNHPFEVTIKDIEHIRFEEDGTSYTLEADGNYHLDTQNAVILDGIVAGLEYTTTSGLSGITRYDGSFDYADGDVVTFAIGNVTLGSIDMNDITDDQVFLQDIASVDRSNMNDEYLENMAVLLQSLDTNANANDGIIISEASRNAFSEFSFDLASVSEVELQEVIEHVGSTVVSEDQAMTHVQSVLEEHTQITEFDARIVDFVLDDVEPLVFENMETAEFVNALNLSETSHDIELTLDDVLTMTDNSELVILGERGDHVSLKDGDTNNWIKSDSSVVENGRTFDVYENGDMIVKVEQDINDTIV